MIESKTKKFGHVNCLRVAFENIGEDVVEADEVYSFCLVLKDLDRVNSTE